MSDKIVRLATENDAEDLSRLNQEFNGGKRVGAAIIKESLKNNDELIAVAIFNGQVVGFACAQSFKSFCYPEAQGEITELYVEESERGKRLATGMIRLLEEKLIARGVTNIKILTGKDNKPAIKTYLRSHYKLDDVLVLEKLL